MKREITHLYILLTEWQWSHVAGGVGGCSGPCCNALISVAF